jgi:hypothetical protein
LVPSFVVARIVGAAPTFWVPVATQSRVDEQVIDFRSATPLGNDSLVHETPLLLVPMMAGRPDKPLLTA